jgi:hypothetical protein
LRDASISTEGQDRPLELLRSVSSRDFNRLVWTQITQLPESAFAVLPHLDMPLTSISDTSTGQIVQLGDDRFGARIELVREGDFLMIDRIWLLAGQADPAELKHSLKSQLAKRGPRGFAVDPLSAHPISTDPSRTATTDSAEADRSSLPELEQGTRGQAPSSTILPTIIESPKRASLPEPADVR